MKATFKALILFAALAFTSSFVFSQQLSPFKQNKKWGFKKGETIVIQPEYDSIFGFDPEGKICLVGNIDPLKRSVNSLTREVKIAYTFRYINEKNERLFFKAPFALDSTSEATPTKYCGALYQTEGNLIIACVSGKKILATKKGKQISKEGYDNILYSKVPGLLLFEIKNGRSLFGLMTNNAEQVIPPLYSKISFNIYDSVIYCCTAGSRSNGMDDVYNYKGEKVHTSNKHIQCAGKNFAIYRLFESENTYIIYDLKEKKEKQIKAEYIYYLKNDTIALLDNDWFFYDLKTEKKTPLDKKLIKYLKLDE